MSGIIIALITGIATVLAALLARKNEGAATTAKQRTGSDNSDGKRLSLKLLGGLFGIGFIAGGLIYGVAARSITDNLYAGGLKVPPGTISAFMGVTPPQGWLLCNGKEEVPKDSELFKVMGLSVSPDLRGRFLRGFDSTGTIDPDGKTRNLGSIQEDLIKKHIHPFTTYQNGAQHPGNGSNGAFELSHGMETGPNADGGTETRPKNVAVNFIIKY